MELTDDDGTITLPSGRLQLRIPTRYIVELQAALRYAPEKRLVEPSPSYISTYPLSNMHNVACGRCGDIPRRVIEVSWRGAPTHDNPQNGKSSYCDDCVDELVKAIDSFVEGREDEFLGQSL